MAFSGRFLLAFGSYGSQHTLQQTLQHTVTHCNTVIFAPSISFFDCFLLAFGTSKKKIPTYTQKSRMHTQKTFFFNI